MCMLLLVMSTGSLGIGEGLNPVVSYGGRAQLLYHAGLKLYILKYTSLPDYKLSAACGLSLCLQGNFRLRIHIILTSVHFCVWSFHIYILILSIIRHTRDYTTYLIAGCAWWDTQANCVITLLQRVAFSLGLYALIMMTQYVLLLFTVYYLFKNLCHIFFFLI